MLPALHVCVQLKEIVGLFIVPPENLKGLMDHGYLARQDRQELFLYISQRADFRWDDASYVPEGRQAVSATAVLEGARGVRTQCVHLLVCCSIGITGFDRPGSGRCSRISAWTT